MNNRDYLLEQCKNHYYDNRDTYLIYSKKYREDNPEYFKEYNKKYREDNPEYFKKYREDNPEYFKEWREDNPEYFKEWREDNPEKIKEYNSKRRNLGHIPLNNHFKGCHFHHLRILPNGELNDDLGINIPEVIHTTFYHNGWTLRKMDVINEISWQWLKWEKIMKKNAHKDVEGFLHWREGDRGHWTKQELFEYYEYLGSGDNISSNPA